MEAGWGRGRFARGSMAGVVGALAVSAALAAPGVVFAEPVDSPVDSPASSVGSQTPNGPSPVRTPRLGEVLNGFVVGALDEGSPASRLDSFRALTARDPFYGEPPLTGAERPGTVLKVKPVDVMFLGYEPGRIDAYKLMYVTTGLDGVTPEISTGIVMIPVDGTPASAKKVVSYQQANDSVGAYCHPSTQWTGGNPLDGSAWSALGPLALMFGKGYAVVISDVGNDGDPDPHAVFAGKYAGHAQLDAVRAALSTPSTGLSAHAPISLFGIAGGGVGAGFAAESQARYAPELNVRSTVLEGMVVNQRNFMRTADGSIGSGFAFATLLGLEPKYPEMRIDEKLNPVGRAIADAYRTQCQTPAYFTMPFVPLETLFAGGRSPADIPEFQPVYDDNLLGAESPKSKVLITSCAKDDSPMSLVPAKDSLDLAERYRAGGADVTYAPSDCSMVRMLTDLYGWGTDLFGMQTIDWIEQSFTE
ncbi:secretory lipase [Rhodococcus sp. OK519]|uniref:lipase family protein n=1 Tax=Rhodococcus sp. OK519 TaxID=2135729 RepID=UPI000D495FA5|nr:secretory lipase [Rhodococcus sp. OK519]